MINISVLVSHYCILFTQTLHKLLQSRRIRLLWLITGLALIKWQHLFVHTAYPPHFKQQKKRATSDKKHVPMFDFHQVVAATAKYKGATGERMEPQLVG